MNSRWLAYPFALVALLGLTLFGTACKGGGGTDSSFIEVLLTSPEDGSTSAQVATRIGFQIDAAIDPATLTSDNFFLMDSEGTLIPATLEVTDDPDTATLTPDEPLSVITSFTATITTDLSSTSGATLEQNFEWRFMTIDSAWGTPEWVEETSTGNSSNQQIEIDLQSNALAVWEYTDPSGTRIWANRYTRVDLWGEPEPIDLGAGAADPQLAVDGAGNGFAVWQEGGATAESRIWTNRYTVEEGWGTPEIVQNGELTAALTPAVAADPDGNAIAIWLQRAMDSSDLVVWANRFSNGSWGAAEPIDDMPTPTGLELHIGMDADGNAIATWRRPGFPGDVIWSNRYRPGMGWGTAELVKPDEATDANNTRLDVGSSGDAFLTWDQEEGMRKDVWSARFSGSSWDMPERIDDFDAGDTVEADIAVDGTGVAHAVWSQSDPDFRNIYANQYTPGDGWGIPELIEPPNDDPSEDADATIPRVEVNSVGNAFVVWRQTFNDWGSIWSNRLDPGTGWMTGELIENDERAGRNPKIAVDENRHAHVIWLHSIATSTDWVRTNRFE